MIFEKENIYLNQNFNSKDEVLRFLAKELVNKGIADDIDTVYKGYIDRENETTTGFGNGVAIPHTKLDSIKHPVVLFIRNNNGIEWKALDGAPVNTMISLAVPSNSANEHLKLLAKLSRQLIHPEFIEILKDGSCEEIWNKINPIVNGGE